MVLKSAVLFFLCASFGFSGFSSYAEILTHAKVDSRDLIGEALKKEISSKFSGAKVDLTSAIHWPQGLAISNPATVTLLDEDGRGAAHFIARGMLGESAEGFVHFAAWAPARVALRRIHPGERLTPDQFVLQDVNVATGQAHEYRGVILAQETPLIGLETRQSVLEGQFLLSSSVSKVPDVRRGDVVRIHMTTNGLAVSTTGTAEEAGYINSTVRVMASKTKRELTGELLPGGVVEVKL